MKTIYAITLAIMITGSQAVAFGGEIDGNGISLLTTLLISFGAMIVLFQFIPGIMLFFGMLKGLYSPAEKKSVNIK
jgi:hypothetical protein